MSEDELTEEEVYKATCEALQPVKDELGRIIGKVDALRADMRASSEALLLTIESPSTKTVQ
ncbi:MAG TPA: hypothetical protein VGT04_03035 [Acidobacteriaceae bacterium]|nr:hypothetical protein [Acidobacteriaceae bacterium]